jgi:hypothetical protein
MLTPANLAGWLGFFHVAALVANHVFELHHQALVAELFGFAGSLRIVGDGFCSALQTRGFLTDTF